MQCPNCQQETVESAVFCNHCGARMPEFCHQCGAANPPASHFCHRCGIALLAQGVQRGTPPHDRRETRLADIGGDFKRLGADLASYSGPRIKRIGGAIGKSTRSVARHAGPRIRSVLRRLRPRAPGDLPRSMVRHAGSGVEAVAERSRPPAQREAGQDQRVSAGSWPEIAARPSFGAMPCPRCGRMSEPGSSYCFACGLPLDERAGGEAWQTGRVVQPAGFGVRLLAWIIDFTLLYATVLGIIVAWVGLADYDDMDALLPWSYYLWLVVTAAYHTIGLSVWSTTIGKRLFRIYVVRADGDNVGVGRALARHFAVILSVLLFGIGCLMIGVREDKRGLHDLICDTVVVRR